MFDSSSRQLCVRINICFFLGFTCHCVYGLYIRQITGFHHCFGRAPFATGSHREWKIRLKYMYQGANVTFQGREARALPLYIRQERPTAKMKGLTPPTKSQRQAQLDSDTVPPSGISYACVFSPVSKISNTAVPSAYRVGRCRADEQSRQAIQIGRAHV